MNVFLLYTVTFFAAYTLYLHVQKYLLVTDWNTSDHTFLITGKGCMLTLAGDNAGLFLFRYLITAEIGLNASKAWNEYLEARDELNTLYSK
jgi:hypothetical protein